MGGGVGPQSPAQCLDAEVQAMGGNRWDTSSLVARLER